MNKTTEALKLSEEALLGSGYYDTTQQRKALAAIREARAEQEKQEPVVKYYGEKLVKGSKVFALLDRDLAPDTLLYAAPVRTKDLTDDEIDLIDALNWEKDNKVWGIREFARAVIAADREKNK